MTSQDNDVIVEDASAMRAPGYSMSGRNDLMSSFTDAVRENPVPAALIGMGALWLFMGGGNVSLFGGRGRSSLVGTVAHGAGSVAHGAGDMAHSAAHSMGRMGSSIASGVSSTVGGFAESVSDGASRLGDYVSSSMHGVDAQSEYRNPNFSNGSSGEGLGATVSHSMDGMRSGLHDMFERHPVALGVAGLALGAAVAASLPLTQQERETLGRANETVRSKLGEVAGQAKDMASAAAEEVAGSAGRGPG